MLEDYSFYFDTLIGNMKQYTGDRPARDLEVHIKDEYSTLDWIMEGLLQKAGFSIKKNNTGKNTWQFICAARFKAKS